MNKRMVHVAGALSLTGVLLAGAVAPRFHANAAGKKVIFVTDVGGLNDNGFNHLGYIGTVAGAKAAGWTFGDIETTNPS
ncbi:MAG: hypothetical protein JWO59_2133, partial [Chloroflexi bacterium]|nr:hypothetical protein [Chloroflexota bacterium]